MITAMTRVEIIGPHDLLRETLAFLQQLGLFHIESDPLPSVFTDRPARGDRARRFLGDRVYYEHLLCRIQDVLAYLPEAPQRLIYLDPRQLIVSLEKIIDSHCSLCESNQRNRGRLQRQIQELIRHKGLFEALAPLIEGGTNDSDLDFIAIPDPTQDTEESAQRIVRESTAGCFDVQTVQYAEHRHLLIVAVRKEDCPPVREAFASRGIREVRLAGTSSPNNLLVGIRAAREELSGCIAERDRLDKSMTEFSRHWSALYHAARRWLQDQLALMDAADRLAESGMCFFISGWIRAADRLLLSGALERTFHGQVLVVEQELRHEDLERVPVALVNPPYFQPFELFTRLLPLPYYSSFDPTPFIGIFFPIFFGMILGDAGYGAILIVAALVLIRKGRGGMMTDAGKILGVSAAYTIVFGFLYGEVLGTMGAHSLGLSPILLNRHDSIVPMLVFALAVGFGHVVLGLTLGAMSALKLHKNKEAMLKAGTVFLLLSLTLLGSTFFLPDRFLQEKPLMASIAASLVIIIVSGGVLAPLEFFKTVGNIISYARIMAVGLTSVLLAHVANLLAGSFGSMTVGILAAVVLHAFNIILGVFAPTIHSLRLHYVEFFSKFIDAGARSFSPLKKTR